MQVNQGAHSLMPKMNADEYSPLALAYLGDVVLEMYVRTRLLEKGNAPVSTLHVQASRIVCAKAQSRMVDRIWDMLTEEEIAIFKRGRNAKSYSSPKNTSIADYHRSTGLESLLGFLYMKQHFARMEEILSICYASEDRQEGA